MTLHMPSAVVDGSTYEVVRFPTDEIWLRVAQGGDVQVTEYRSDDRDGPPPHCHEWDEIEYVIEGEVEFYQTGSWHVGGPGTVQLLPAGAAHSVRVPEGSARLLMITIGAPYDGFAREIASLYDRGEVTGADVVAVGARHGVRLGGEGVEAI